MTGASMDERNEKLKREMEYRALLKQQMEEAEAKKEKARREKKERQEQVGATPLAKLVMKNYELVCITRTHPAPRFFHRRSSPSSCSTSSTVPRR